MAAEVPGARDADKHQHVVPRSPAIPLGKLDPRAFEELVDSLLQGQIRRGMPDFDKVVLLPEGPDRGRDLLLYKNLGVAAVVQCKRVGARISRDQILIELFKFILFALADRPDLVAPGLRYELWTATPIAGEAQEFMASPARAFDDNPAHLLKLVESARKKSKRLGACDDVAGAGRQAANQQVLRLARGLTLSYVGPETISQLLDADPATRRRYFDSPDDVHAIATDEEVEALVASLRDEQLIAFAREGKGARAPYVPAEGVEEAFGKFEEGNFSAFAIVGGNGHGKSTWAAALLRRPSSATPWMIHGGDIAESDRHILETLARLLAGRPIDPRLVSALPQALHGWFQRRPQLIIVDALDRVRTTVRPGLDGWLAKSIALIQGAGRRIVLTSRPEAWRQLSAGLRYLARDFAPQKGWNDERGLPARQLDSLTAGNAHKLYVAYGLTPPGFRQRYLRTPSLIHMLSSLQQAAPALASPTRLDVLRASVEVVGADAAVRASIGTVSFRRLQHGLGKALAAGGDGWLPVESEGAFGLSDDVLDRLVDIDFVRLDQGRVRPANDDLIEYLMGQVLDLGAAIATLDAGAPDDLFLGSLGIAGAFAEEKNPETGADMLRAILGTGPVTLDGAREKAAMAWLLDLRDHGIVLDVVQRLFAAWDQKNFLLDVVPLGNLVSNLRLAAPQRLEALLTLAGTEDPDDWRDKFWFRPRTQGRMITAFAGAAVQAVREAPAEALEQIDLLLDGHGVVADVANALAFEALIAAPDLTLAYFWGSADRGELLDSLFSLKPAAAARFIAGIENPTSEMARYLGETLWRHASRGLDEDREPIEPALLEAAATRLLPTAGDEYQRTRLQLSIFVATPTVELLDILLSNIDEFDQADVWHIINAMPTEGKRILDVLFDQTGGTLLGSASFRSLMIIHPDADLLESIGERMIDCYDRATDPRVRENLADGVEALLRKCTDPTEAPSIWELALRMARVGSAAERKYLLYYAGSQAYHDERSNPALQRQRDALFDELVAAEDGAQFGLLFWKLLESSMDRPGAQHRLDVLVARFGRGAVLAELPRALMMMSGRGPVSVELRQALDRLQQ